MNRIRLAVPFAAVALVGVVACSPQPAAPVAPAAPATPPPVASPVAAPAAQAGTVSGTVAETMNSGGYTYARLQTGQKDVWIAATEFAVASGERLTAAIDMPMENFHSKTLNRDFPLIYFVTGVTREGGTPGTSSAAAGMPAPAGSHAPEGTAAPQVVTPMPPPKGGLSIADLWAKRASLSGKTVVVRGQVVKVNNGIMGRNWFHLQDGTGSAKDGTNDLTATSAAVVNMGDLVTVSGTLATGKDFGAGYAYDAIVENATVTQTERLAKVAASQGARVR